MMHLHRPNPKVLNIACDLKSPARYRQLDAISGLVSDQRESQGWGMTWAAKRVHLKIPFIPQ